MSIFSWLLITSFSSMLITTKTNSAVSLGFADIDALLKDTNYQIIVEKDTTAHRAFTVIRK